MRTTKLEFDLDMEEYACSESDYYVRWDSLLAELGLSINWQ